MAKGVPNNIVKLCEICKKEEFVAASNRQKYCHKCKRTAWKQQKGIKKCNVCNIELIKDETWGNYTSWLCRDHYREYRKEDYVRRWEDVRASMKKYEARNNHTERRKKQRLETSKRMREKYPEKWVARLRLRNAVKKGDIQKMPCEVCHEPNVHAHHYAGYEGDAWAKVRWLCPAHHGVEHRKVI